MHNFIIGPTDTDSISFCKPDMSPFDEKELQSLLNEINEISPEYMDWADDGLYDACLVLKAKNYVLVKDAKYIYKGSSLRDMKREPAVREMLAKLIQDIIENESKGVVPIYESYIKEAMNIKDISRWVTKKTITKSVLNGGDEDARMNESKVLDAIDEVVTRGVSLGYQEGDKVYLYNAIDGEVQAVVKGELVFKRDGSPKMIPNYVLRDQRLWSGDQDAMHYVGRVYKTVEILSNVLNMEAIMDYTLKRNREVFSRLVNE